MRNDVRHLAGRLIGKKDSTAAPNGQGEEDTVAFPNTEDAGLDSSVPRPPSETGLNPWRDAGPGPSQPVPSASYPRQHRLSFDQYAPLLYIILAVASKLFIVAAQLV